MTESTPSLRFLASEFEVERELGRGGMAVVYLARERALGRLVALKVMRAELLEDAEAVARLEREARVVAQLAHPNVVMVHGIRRWEPHGLALVLQYVEGETLKARIGRLGPLPAGEIERVVRQLAGALGYAHRRGIIHRDLKPENVYLEEETGRALLGDFGIARVLDEQAHLTQTGAVVGTPAYMAPEQIDGAGVDARSDMYSLGLVAYAMATGKQPWAGESLYSIIYKQKHERLAGLGTVRQDLSLRLVQAIEGCLGKEPGERWESAAALVAALDGGERATARAPGSAGAVRRASGRPGFDEMPAREARAGVEIPDFIRKQADCPSASALEATARYARECVGATARAAEAMEIPDFLRRDAARPAVSVPDATVRYEHPVFSASSSATRPPVRQKRRAFWLLVTGLILVGSFLVSDPLGLSGTGSLLLVWWELVVFALIGLTVMTVMAVRAVRAALAKGC